MMPDSKLMYEIMFKIMLMLCVFENMWTAQVLFVVSDFTLVLIPTTFSDVV